MLNPVIDFLKSTAPCSISMFDCPMPQTFSIHSSAIYVWLNYIAFDCLIPCMNFKNLCLCGKTIEINFCLSESLLERRFVKYRGHSWNHSGWQKQIVAIICLYLVQRMAVRLDTALNHFPRVYHSTGKNI